MKVKHKQIIIQLLIVLLTSSCNSNTSSNIHAGELRIVSLVPSITEEVISLGLKNNIVGATSYCSITKNKKDLIIGSAISINIEKILLIKPSIVFASGLISDVNINALKRNGINVYQFDKVTSFEDICKNYTRLGELLGKKDLAKSLISKYKKNIDSLIFTLPNHKNKLSMVIQIGVKPLSIVIPHTFMNDYTTILGYENIANDFSTITTSRETIISRNPDIIFIATMGELSNREKELWESYKDLKASKNNNIFTIDANIACMPTVFSFAKTLEAMTKKINLQ